MNVKTYYVYKSDADDVAYVLKSDFDLILAKKDKEIELLREFKTALSGELILIGCSSMSNQFSEDYIERIKFISDIIAQDESIEKALKALDKAGV